MYQMVFVFDTFQDRKDNTPEIHKKRTLFRIILLSFWGAWMQTNVLNQWICIMA